MSLLVSERGSLTFLIPTLSQRVLEFESKGKLTPSRWHFLSFSLNALNLEISLNGLPDSSFKLSSESTLSSSPSQISSASSSTISVPSPVLQMISKPLNKNEGYLQVSLGKSKLYPSAAFYLDEIKLFKIFQSHIKLRQLAISQEVPFADEEIRIGCINCSFSEAAKTCAKDFHLCTQQEIYSFAFQIARINGWTQQSKKIWTFSPITDELIHSKDKKLGLCCRNSVSYTHLTLPTICSV